jgi:hypothetical protein
MEEDLGAAGVIGIGVLAGVDFEAWLDLRTMMMESLVDKSESLPNFFLRLVGVLEVYEEGFAVPSCCCGSCDIPMYCILGERERLSKMLEE